MRCAAHLVGILILGCTMGAYAEGPDFEALQKMYDRYELPRPPRSAPLIRYADKEHGRIGWLLSQDPEWGEATLLYGTHTLQVVGFGSRLLDADEAYLSKDRQDSPRWFDDPLSEFVTVLQLWSHGDAASAQALWKAISPGLDSMADMHDLGARPDAVKFDPAGELASEAWRHWVSTLTRPKSDRSHALEMLRLLSKDSPAFRGGREAELIRLLALTLEPSRAKRGTAEALVDDLIDAHNEGSGLADTRLPVGPRLRAICALGFEAIPVLLAHLDDDRLTRTSTVSTKRTTPDLPQRVSEVVGGILQAWSEGDTRLPDAPLPEAYAAWWKIVSRESEGESLEKRAISMDPNRRVSNRLICATLADRHPERLRAVYLKLLKDFPEKDSGPVAELLAACSLTKDQKMASLLEGANSTLVQHRHGARVALMQFDRDLATRLIIEDMDSLPPAEPSLMGVRDRAMNAAAEVVLLDRREAWAALDRAARRASTAYRAKLLFPPGISSCNHVQEYHYLQFLRAFLEDEFVPVRRTVACHLAESFHLEDGPDNSWSPGDWEKFEKRVREESLERLGP